MPAQWRGWGGGKMPGPRFPASRRLPARRPTEMFRRNGKRRAPQWFRSHGRGPALPPASADAWPSSPVRDGDGRRTNAAMPAVPPAAIEATAVLVAPSARCRRRAGPIMRQAGSVRLLPCRPGGGTIGSTAAGRPRDRWAPLPPRAWRRRGMRAWPGGATSSVAMPVPRCRCIQRARPGRPGRVRTVGEVLFLDLPRCREGDTSVAPPGRRGSHRRRSRRGDCRRSPVPPATAPATACDAPPSPVLHRHPCPLPWTAAEERCLQPRCRDAPRVARWRVRLPARPAAAVPAVRPPRAAAARPWPPG
jgi:hypothetical protein